MRLNPKLVLTLGGIAAGLLAVGALMYKASIAVQIPARVDKLEAGQIEMAKRIDGLVFDVQRMRMSQEESDRRSADWQQRMTTVISEMSGSVRSLTASIEAQARENIRTSEQVKNLQVITDQLTDESRSHHQ